MSWLLIHIIFNMQRAILCSQKFAYVTKGEVTKLATLIYKDYKVSLWALP